MAVIVLSMLVLGCVMTEAYKRGLLGEEGKKKQQTDDSSIVSTSPKGEDSTEDENKIRVVIKTNDFAAFLHKSVKFTSNKPFRVTIGEQSQIYKAKEVVTYKVKDRALKGKKVQIEPQDGGRVKLLSIKRQSIHPSYRGNMELAWEKKGFVITNIVPIEEYLYAVVPSELSTGHKMEALKAQAVCARSYIYNQIDSKRYPEYNANVDDSVSCQVYNNNPEDKRARKAVNATRGQILECGGKPVITYYFSTSWGSTASGKDVWNTKSEVSYLQEKLQITEESSKETGIQSLNLSQDADFRDFINNRQCDTYDSQSDWYRWNVTISAKSLAVRLDSSLAACYAVNPGLVLTQTKTGKYKQKPIQSIGKVKNIRVEKRAASGLATELVIIGKKAVVKVCSQYNIRKVLAPLYEQISYQNGNGSTTMQLLPSAAFYVDRGTKDNKTAFRLTGGGFGHGCGMSQEGAARMAEMGKSYQEILAQYFTGAQITSKE